MLTDLNREGKHIVKQIYFTAFTVVFLDVFLINYCWIIRYCQKWQYSTQGNTKRTTRALG